MISSDFFRPAEVETLLGDCSLAKSELGWHPETTFLELVNEMALADFEIVKNNGVNLNV